MQLPTLTRDAVLKAIEECQASTEARFLRYYGFGDRNIKHRIQHQGEKYPAKAIMGRAFWHVDKTLVRAADLRGKGGKHAMARLADVGLHPEETAVASPSTSAASASTVLVVACEQNTADVFERGAQPSGAGTRTEADLMRRLEKHLRVLGHHPGRLRIQPADGKAQFATDTYDVTSNVLYEVKATAERKSVRMAIGQLLDYARYRTPRPRLAIVLPESPGQDLQDLIESIGMTLVVDSDVGFIGLPDSR
ncbi:MULTISPECIES: hypothetical protein [Arsenicicoccus]|uniref:hypothetical protein n=1 Tax=Arsenicicoccus TaxID=267408 RepID=UPI00257B53C8|nr:MULTISPECIES: hypothetical protein [Arsenicicoccus]